MLIKTKKEIHEHILDDFDHRHLEPEKIYEVIGIDYDSYRIIDEIGEPILYPKYLFDIIDPSIPESWIREEHETDHYYIDPPELSAPGFYEDYFDKDAKARAIFEQFLIKKKKVDK